MYAAGMFLGCLLWCQTSDAVALPQAGRPAPLDPAIRASNEVESARPLASVANNSRRPSAPEAVAALLVAPAASALTGQAISLQAALASTPDRRRQLEIAISYWQTVLAAAEYYCSLEYAKTLDALSGDAPAMRFAKTSAAARVRQAELEAFESQCALALAMQMPLGAPLPMPTDRPHVGAYRTQFQELFAASGRPAPEPLMMLDRVIAIRRQAIDQRAAAVQAAEDVLLSIESKDASAVAAAARALLDERLAMLRAAADYNRDIARYGLTVAGPTSSPQALAAMLIGPAQQAAAPPSEVRPTAAVEPTAPVDEGGWRLVEPTLNPPREGLQPAGHEEPTLAPPRKTFEDAPKQMEAKPLVPVEAPPQSHTANKPATLSAFEPTYPAMRAAAPTARAKLLASALFGDGTPSQSVSGRPMSLVDCVARATESNRLAAIKTYWRVGHRATVCRVLDQQIAWLDDLADAALEHRRAPDEMLRLQAARQSARADAGEARAALVEAQYDLALRLGAAGEPQWPIGSPVPHAGGYALKLEAQPAALAASWPIRRLAPALPALGAGSQRQAEAAIEADALRAACATAYRDGSGDIQPSLEAIAAQTRQTLDLLQTLLDYNWAIAEYVLGVMPSSTPPGRIVAALVVNP